MALPSAGARKAAQPAAQSWSPRENSTFSQKLPISSQLFPTMPTPLTNPYRNLTPGKRQANQDGSTPMLGRVTPAPAPQPGNLNAPAGTAVNPSPAPTAITQTVLARPEAARAATTVKPGRSALPNQGGSITKGGVQSNYAATSADFNRNRVGSIDRGNTRTLYNPTQPAAPVADPVAQGPAGGNNRTLNLRRARGVQTLAPSGAPVASPTTVAAPQTEARNPLSGASNQQMEGTTDPLPGQSLGFSRRGNMLPRGYDALPLTGVGPTGVAGSRFRSQASSNAYQSYLRRVMGPQRAPV